MGRGPLAGPVVAAAVFLPADFDILGLDDSKRLTKIQRETESARLHATTRVAVGQASVEEIDELNILQASFLAMERAYATLDQPMETCYVDGNRLPASLQACAVAVVKGDAKLASIAAASIVAKVFRDEVMVRYAAQYPQYGFDSHMGYPTPRHQAALNQHGPCPIHRHSYAPVRASFQNRRAQGQLAEDVAADYLRGRGFTVITRRFSTKGGELDLVMLDGDELVFVEVKQRGQGQIAPEETIGPRKMFALRRAAVKYLEGIGQPDRDFRWDLVVLDDQGLRHYPRALGEWE